jgi:TrmH family RNA methyltransferase
MPDSYFKNINIILNKTINPGNIGSTARAMKNMGLSSLCLVEPQCEVDDDAYRMATHGKDILNNLKIFDSITDAAADSIYLFGTTARNRKWRDTISPMDMVVNIKDLVPFPKVSILFGPEDFGLTNNELELCNEVIVIPTADDAASINISQAVLIICYEIFKSFENMEPMKTKPEKIDLAPIDKVEDMYAHMQKALTDIDYLDPQNPEHFMGNFRRILNRAGLTSEDVQVIRGIFRKLNWYVNSTKE